jgi:hypothetical protein
MGERRKPRNAQIHVLGPAGRTRQGAGAEAVAGMPRSGSRRGRGASGGEAVRRELRLRPCLGNQLDHHRDSGRIDLQKLGAPAQQGDAEHLAAPDQHSAELRRRNLRLRRLRRARRTTRTRSDSGSGTTAAPRTYAPRGTVVRAMSGMCACNASLSDASPNTVRLCSWMLMARPVDTTRAKLAPGVLREREQSSMVRRRGRRSRARA